MDEKKNREEIEKEVNVIIGSKEPSPEKNKEKKIRKVYTELFSDIIDREYVPATAPKGGWLRYYKTPTELAQTAIDYFTKREIENRPISIRGFINFSKLNTYKGFDEYLRTPGPYTEEYKVTVQRIKGIIEEYNIDGLYSINFQGSRFALTCGFGGWIPKEEVINTTQEYKIDMDGEIIQDK